MEKQTRKCCADKERIIAILHDTCANYEARIKRFQTLARNRRKNAAQQKKGVQPEDVMPQISARKNSTGEVPSKISRCVKCGEKLRGHEDENGTHCRWCVTGGDQEEHGNTTSK